MDATRGTNMYDFKFITLLVLDDFGEGILVAGVTTDRKDATMVIEFFTAIKHMTGVLKSPLMMQNTMLIN